MSEHDVVDGSAIRAEAAEIAFPRYPGSEGDRRAIELVASKLRAAGLEVAVEEFSYDIRPAFRAIRSLLIASAALVIGAGAISLWSAAVALALLATAAVVGGVLLVWAPGTERLYARPGPTRTSNVAGHRRANRPRLRLVVLAHHDSKSQNLTFPVRMGLTLGALAATSALAILLAASLVRGAPAGAGWIAPGCGMAAAAALLVLATLRSGNESPGGVDNAGSVAIVLDLARRLPPLVSESVDLVFLSPGAEEDHMVGAMRWLASHRDDLGGCPVLALNFDGAGAPGKVVLIERYGLGKPFSPELSRTAREAARRLGIAVRGITMLPGIGIDAIPFDHRGVGCLTLSSGSLDRATLSVHSANDVARHLDARTLARVASLGLAIAVDIAERYAPNEPAR